LSETTISSPNEEEIYGRRYLITKIMTLLYTAGRNVYTRAIKLPHFILMAIKKP
jgi:hypothetical protein